MSHIYEQDRKGNTPVFWALIASIAVVALGFAFTGCTPASPTVVVIPGGGDQTQQQVVGIGIGAPVPALTPAPTASPTATPTAAQATR